MLAALTVFGAAYVAVLLLGLQSKLMRDDRWQMCFFVSWAIMVAQTAGTYAIAHNILPLWGYLLAAGWGSSLGIVTLRVHMVRQTTGEETCSNSMMTKWTW